MGMYDTYAGLIIPKLASAMSVFMMRAAFTTLPKELEEAARIDGISEFGLFWKVMLPLVKPTMVTLIILGVNGAWNDLLWPLLITSSTDMRTLALRYLWVKIQFNTALRLQELLYPFCQCLFYTWWDRNILLRVRRQVD